MNIDFKKENGQLLVKLDGRLDTVTAPAFDSFIQENCADTKQLILDCAALSYVSSAGLRVLLGAQKKLGGAMKLQNVCELVMEVFEMTGFADILTIE